MAKTPRVKEYGEIIDAWIDKKYPEIKLLQEANKILWGKEKGNERTKTRNL